MWRAFLTLRATVIYVFVCSRAFGILVFAAASAFAASVSVFWCHLPNDMPPVGLFSRDSAAI